MNKTTSTETNPTSAFQALLGELPFMAYGLVSISIHFGNSLPRPPICLHPFLLFDALVLIGLGAGIPAGRAPLTSCPPPAGRLSTCCGQKTVPFSLDLERPGLKQVLRCHRKKG
ncbi:MAG: hypothetical protein MUO64_09800 [Anaerolineales bacterium]|nr:hypothetical protein [Anaerolineales bacterium]